ncbi:OLC1v1017574C1 [Oldenlandia corymbosa var. corymbosa]|uniref:OLC1v1017574C1 n=1 Tax=Oldenlandia corymbosa var. corymbosa TaxID=529605 RepID=A0AAV1E9Q8_OLDCO|nr:OLC1v1017574C1 [Oldenlandia corymbosa var. corymbosa]
MSSKLIQFQLPRYVCFPISELSFHHRTSNIFLIPTIFPGYAEKLPPSSNSISVVARKKIIPFSTQLPSSSSPENGEEDKKVEEEGVSDYSNHVETARDALRQYLEEEIGVSMEESVEISSNSPNYVDMLIHSIGELEEVSSLSSAAAPPSWSESDQLSFRSKVYEMAKWKGDKGILPYLESIGLTLSSASHLGRRYLSSHTLPTLIHQVKYVRKLFFSDSEDDGGLAGNSARRMMMYLSISVDEDIQQTLSFFEKIQARRGGLELLGSGDASFRHLIESFPALLSLPLESAVNPMVEFLEENGVPRGSVGKIFLLFPPILFFDLEKDLKPRLLALQKVGVEYNDYAILIQKYPWVLSTSILHNFREILSFFDEEKVPLDGVTRGIINWPLLLGCSVKRLKMMVEQFRELQITNKKLGRLIARSPQLLVQKIEEFVEVITFFKDLGLDDASIGRMLARRPEIFAVSIEETLKRKIGFLTSIGILKDHLPRVVKKYPDMFVCDVDRALRPRVKYLMKIGISKKDVGFMVRRFSPLLGYSIEGVLRPKLEFLIRIMEKPLRDVVDYPRYFSYSLEKKIKPRYWVLKGRNLDCSLKDMLNKNDEEFAAAYMDVGSGTHLQPVE